MHQDQDISTSSSSHIGHAFNHVRVPVPASFFFIHDMLPNTCQNSSTCQENAASFYRLPTHLADMLHIMSAMKTL